MVSIFFIIHHSRKTYSKEKKDNKKVVEKKEKTTKEIDTKNSNQNSNNQKTKNSSESNNNNQETKSTTENYNNNQKSSSVNNNSNSNNNVTSNSNNNNQSSINDNSPATNNSNVPATNPEPVITYYCPDGYTLNNTTCTSTIAANYVCPPNTTDYSSNDIPGDTYCVNLSDGYDSDTDSCPDNYGVIAIISFGAPTYYKCLTLYKKIYTCNDGYTLNGTTCTKTINAQQK